MAPSPEVVAKTAALLEERYGCAVCGAIDGFTVAAPEAVAGHLSAGAPTCPRQPSAGGVVATHALTIGAPLTSENNTLHRLLLIELLVTAAVLAALVALSLWLVRVGLRPLRQIEETATAITAGDA